MLEAEQQFRRIIGYRDLAKLVDRHRARPRSLARHTDTVHTPTKEAAIARTV